MSARNRPHAATFTSARRRDRHAALATARTVWWSARAPQRTLAIGLDNASILVVDLDPPRASGRSQCRRSPLPPALYGFGGDGDVPDAHMGPVSDLDQARELLSATLAIPCFGLSEVERAASSC